MARTPSMTPQECEALLGPRGRLFVTADNVHNARKWLTANGVPGMYAAGLARAAIASVYNDLSNAKLEQAKLKAQEADDIDCNSAAAAILSAPPSDEAIAQAQAFGAPQAAPAPQNNDANRIAAVVAAVMSSMGPQVDMAQIGRDIDARLNSLLPNLQRQVEAKLEELAENAAIRIEVKAHDSDEFVQLEGAHHPQFAKLLKAAASRQADGFHPNIWISGPAGSGKTYAAKTVAKALGLAFEYNGALSMPHELLGFIDAGGTYHETPFRKAYSSAAVYLFDEVDGSDNTALLALNAALANGRASFPDGQAERHADSVIIATANTWGLGATADYVGRAKIDAAFLSRFPVRIQWDYDTDMEQSISGNAGFAKRVQKAREKAKAAGIKVLIDPRASIAGAALIAGGFSSDEAASMTYLANLTVEQRRMVEG